MPKLKRNLQSTALGVTLTLSDLVWAGPCARPFSRLAMRAMPGMLTAQMAEPLFRFSPAEGALNILKFNSMFITSPLDLNAPSREFRR